MFVKDLRAAVPLVRPSRRRAGDNRRRVLRGIAVRDLHSDGPRTTPAQERSAAAGPGWAEDQQTAAQNGDPATEPDEIERLLALFRETDPGTPPGQEAPPSADDGNAGLDFDALRRQT